jgi:hypothetical protein
LIRKYLNQQEKMNHQKYFLKILFKVNLSGQSKKSLEAVTPFDDLSFSLEKEV